MWWHSVPKCAPTTNCNLFCGPSAAVLNAWAVSIICTFLFIEMATKISFLYRFIVCIGYSAAVGYCSRLSISLIPRIAHTHASPSCSCYFLSMNDHNHIIDFALASSTSASSSYIPHSWYCFTNSDGRGWGLTIRLWYSQRTSACQAIALRQRMVRNDNLMVYFE